MGLGLNVTVWLLRLCIAFFLPCLRFAFNRDTLQDSHNHNNGCNLLLSAHANIYTFSCIAFYLFIDSISIIWPPSMYQVTAHSLYFEGVICLVGAAHTSMIMKHTQLHQVTVCQKHGADRRPFKPGLGSFSVRVIFKFDLEEWLGMYIYGNQCATKFLKDDNNIDTGLRTWQEMACL